MDFFSFIHSIFNLSVPQFSNKQKNQHPYHKYVYTIWSSQRIQLNVRSESLSDEAHAAELDLFF